VGRFNSEQSGASVYRFAKNKLESDKFHAEKELNYKSFIDVIGPTLTENHGAVKVTANESLPFFTILSQQKNTTPGNTSYKIDPYNYFFLRAISSTKHDFFLQNRKKDAPINNLIDETPGITIFRQMQASLQNFCAFQSRNFDLIRSFTQLLVANAGYGGIPVNFADGAELPVNFVPLFVDYLYQEGPHDFNTSLLDFSADTVWQVAVEESNKPTFLYTLKRLVTVYKESLLRQGDTTTETTIPGLDLRELSNLANTDLKKAFIASRESYNILRQITRSKVLLSMVLHWAVEYFNTLPSAVAASKGVQRSQAIENAINEGSDGLAAPINKLPGDMKVDDLINDFKLSFPILIAYVNDPSLEKTQMAFQALSSFAQTIGDSILKDQQKTESIRLIMKIEPQQRASLLKSIESFLTDVVIPRLFKEPGLTSQELLRKYKEYESDLFLTSAILEIADGADIGQFFDMDQALSSKEKVLGDLITGIVKFLVQPQVQKNIADARQTLINYGTLRNLGMADNKKFGIGWEVPMLPAKENAYETSVLDPRKKEQIGLLNYKSPERQQEIKLLLLAEPQDIIEDGLEKSNGNLSLALKSYVNDDNEDKLTVSRKIETIVENDVKIYFRSLSKIYARYASPDQFSSFKRKVEALTLAKLLLLQKDELGLGKEGTNLYDLLLDMVEMLNGAEPNLKEFFARHSLTKYIRQSIFSHNGLGFTALTTALKNQAETSLKNVMQYVSELQGIKYLFDFVSKENKEAEIIVINGDSNDFIDWLTANLKNPNANLLNPQNLVKQNNPDKPDDKYFPAVIFMTNLAFNKNGWNDTFSEKENFVKKLGPEAKTLLRDGSITSIIPPICLDTSVIDPANNKGWITEGNSLDRAAQNAIAPILIVGPSLALNDEKDPFHTTLSSGYVFCAHLLAKGSKQQLTLTNVNAQPTGRFQNIGKGNAGVTITTQNIIGALDMDNQQYAFAADYYLYLIALVAGFIRHSGNQHRMVAQTFWDDFYSYFYYDQQNNFRNSSLLDNAMIYGSMSDWSFDNNLANRAPLQFVKHFTDKQKREVKLFTDIQWFQSLRKTLDF
jgi:hypothetical protein